MPTPLPLRLKPIALRPIVLQLIANVGSASMIGVSIMSANVIGAGVVGLGLTDGSINTAIAQTEPSLPSPDDAATESSDAAVGEFPEIKLGMKGGVVTELQIVLERLDYYEGDATGTFDEATQTAVANFQTAQGLEPTGSLDLATYDALEKQTRKAERQAKRKAKQQSDRLRKFVLVGVAGVGGLAGFVIGIYLLFRFVNRSPRSVDEDWLEEAEDTVADRPTDEAEIDQWVEPVTPLPPEPLPPRQPLHLAPIAALQPVDPPKLEAIAPLQDNSTAPAPDPSPASSLTQDVWTDTEPEETLANHHSSHRNGHALVPQSSAPPPTAPLAHGQAPQQALIVRPTPEPLPKTDVIEELIRELQSPDPNVRRQAIWELAQKADSRAVQPLVNLLLDSDSQQQSLVLEALSQIGVRTLKPINRALALSLQDDNAQVRKNAIRDVSRIYALLSQLSQLIYYATDDPDTDVQETAQWALEQLKKIRVPHRGE